MKTKNLALGGVAAAALLFAAPAFAQTSPTQTPPPGTSSQDNGLYGSQVNPPQHSSAAAEQETRELNEQSIGGVTQSPATLNGEAPATSAPTNAPLPSTGGPQSSNVGAIYRVAQNDDPQQQYQQQQQQYQQQQQQYQEKQGLYEDQKRQYDHDIRRYDQAQWNYTDYPGVYAYHYDDSPSLLRLDHISDASQLLANVPVEGPSGVWVGRIRNVETGPDGQPSRVEIALNHRVSVWVDADNLRFDTTDHVAFTDRTRDELWDMPGATVVPG